jgi:hypothetical protein
LVRGEESHEHWHLDDLNDSGSIDIKMSPGLVEVGLKISLEGSTLEFFMGGKDLLGSSSGGGWVHEELAGWETFLGLELEGEVKDHGSHEDVVVVGGESSWDNSGVLLLSEHASGTSVEVLQLLWVLDWNLDEHGVLHLTSTLVGDGTVHVEEGDGIGGCEDGSNSKGVFHFSLNLFR